MASGRLRRGGIWKRGKVWWLTFTVGERRVRTPARDPQTGAPAQTKEEAKDLLAAIRADLLRGAMRFDDLRRRRRRQGPTVAELCGSFLTDYRGPRVRDLEAYRSDARALLAHVTGECRCHHAEEDPDRPARCRKCGSRTGDGHGAAHLSLGEQRAETLASLDVEQLRDALLACGASPQTTLHVLHRLSRAIDWARKQGILRRADNPVRGVDKPAGPRTGEPIAPERYLSAAEAGELLAWSSKHAPFDAPLYAAAIYTGMREGELLRLRWSDVDLAAGRILVRESKTGRSRSVPVNPALRTILKAWRKLPEQKADGLVFGEPDGTERVPLTVRRRLAKALASADVRSVRFHDLRHTAASLLVSSGVDLLAVSRILGHAGVAMTARYSHLGADQLSAAVGRVKLPRRRR